MCRRIAEHKLVREVVTGADNLDTVFKTLPGAEELEEIPLYKGSRDFGRICHVQPQEGSKSSQDCQEITEHDIDSSVVEVKFVGQGKRNSRITRIWICSREHH